MVVVNIDSDYVNAQAHKPLGVDTLTVLDEFKPMKTEYGDKFTGKVQTNDAKPEVKLYQMNNTSAKLAAKVLGKDTAAWVGKKLAISYVLQNVGGEMKDVVYVDENRTIALNSTPTQTQSKVVPSVETAGQIPQQDGGINPLL